MRLNDEKIKYILSEIGSTWSEDKQETIRDFIWQYYCECHPISDPYTRERELSLEPVFRELSAESADVLFDSISELCIAYQRTAFWAGIRLGLQLWEELQHESLDS